jgi:DmsE family decaheme c-type cytochrome
MKALKQLLAAVCYAGVLHAGVVLAADAPKEAKEAPKDIVLRGDAVCTQCHDESDSPKVLAIGATRHGVRADGRTPKCTDCHGESATHVKEAGRGSGKAPLPDIVFAGKNVSAPKQANEACQSCHDKDRARNNWTGSQHDIQDVACTSCHKVHAKQDNVRVKKTQADVCFTCHKNERTDSHKFSRHPISEGKVTCSDCHNPHGSAGPKMLKKNTLNETCFTCHAEKRGPMLWEHQPVTEDCSTCHTPHGSNLSPLLKARPNFLCQECHNGVHQSGTPVGPNAAGFQGGTTVQNKANATNYAPAVGNVGRACMNCHTMVHGSNSPTGAWLHR